MIEISDNIGAIIAASVSGFSAIICAVINYYAIIKTKAKSMPEAGKKSTIPTEIKSTIEKKTKKPYLKRIADREKKWIKVISIIVPYIILSIIIWPAFFAIINIVIIIPVITIILSVIWPIKPFTSMIAVMSLHPINIYLGEFLIKTNYFYLQGSSTVTRETNKYFSSSWAHTHLEIFLLIIAINIIIVGAICHWKIKTEKGKQIKITEHEKKWISVMCALAPWLIFSPFLWDMYGFNLVLIIPVVTIALSVFIAIKPIIAVSIIFILHLLNLLLGVTVSGISNSDLLLNLVIFLLIVTGNILAAGIICRRQIR